MIESAYPNPLSVSEMARYTLESYDLSWHFNDHFIILLRNRQTHSDEMRIESLLSELKCQGLVKVMGDNGTQSQQYTRVVRNENQVKVVKQMPKIVPAKQPSIAIITAQYCEKLAVDSMMDNPETFVRYTTVGESNVYTLGQPKNRFLMKRLVFF